MTSAVLVADRARPVEQAGTRHELMTRYARELGWPLLVDGDVVMLPPSLGIVGLSLRVAIAGEVNTAVRQLEHDVPVIAVPGRLKQWVFLAYDFGGEHGSIPSEVDLLTGPRHRILLPPTVLAAGPVSWITEPPSRRIAEIGEVLAAMRQVLRPRLI